MELKKFMEVHRARIDKVLASLVDGLEAETAPDLRKAMRYGLLLGGKRVRPFLVYATGTMLGICEDALDAPAAAIECIHAYSLIHDDLPCMDDDELRRGHPTSHMVFGEAQAMLAGDALQALAFQALSGMDMPGCGPESRLEAMKILADGSGYLGMCGGQSLDLVAEGKKVPLDELEKIHRHKTGALIKASVMMAAAMRTDLPESERSALENYAEAIGLAFQIHDDILDVTSDTQTLGKPQGSDVENEKSTYPALLGLDGAIAYEQRAYESALASLSKLNGKDTSVLRQFAEYIVSRKN